MRYNKEPNATVRETQHVDYFQFQLLPHPRNCMLAGPREMILLASPSPSTSGGGLVSFCGFTRRQVMRVGAAQVRGGMMTRRPLCLLPRIEPPRASTIKLTRNLSLDVNM